MNIEEKHRTKDDEVEDNYLKTLPLFVSIPRSGCNWFQPVLELYFNRHRVMKHPNSPSWMEGDPNENPLWMHAHDNFHDKLDIPKIYYPSVFLYRNPVDVIFSLCQLLGGNKEKIDDWIERYARCYNKWTNMDGVLCLEYEKLLLRPTHGIELVHNHWVGFHNLEQFDLIRAMDAVNMVGNKQSVNEKNGRNGNFKNPACSTREYDTTRDQFRTGPWGNYIREKVGQLT